MRHHPTSLENRRLEIPDQDHEEIIMLNKHADQDLLVWDLVVLNIVADHQVEEMTQGQTIIEEIEIEVTADIEENIREMIIDEMMIEDGTKDLLLEKRIDIDLVREGIVHLILGIGVDLILDTKEIEDSRFQ